MADTIFTTQTPATVASDTTPRNLGERFETTQPNQRAAGGRVWVPSSGLADVDHWVVWDQNTATVLADVDLHTIGPITPGGWNDIPEALANFALPDTPGQQYIVTHYRNGPGSFDFEYTSPGGYPVSSGGAVRGVTGVYRNSGTATDMPTDTFDSYHFADIYVVPIASEQVVPVDQAASRSVPFDITPQLLADQVVPVDQAASRSVPFDITPQQLSDQVVPIEQARSRSLAFDITPVLTAATPDRMWAPVLAALRDCLCAELAKSMWGSPCACVILRRNGAPGDCTPGIDGAPPPITGTANGLAWVRKVDVAQFGTADRCLVAQTATIELGVIRCTTIPEDPLSLGEYDTLNDEALMFEADDAAMRRAALCCGLPGEEWDVTLGRWLIASGGGGCQGGIQLITITRAIK